MDGPSWNGKEDGMELGAVMLTEPWKEKIKKRRRGKIKKNGGMRTKIEKI